MKKTLIILAITLGLLPKNGFPQNQLTDSLFRLLAEYPKADTGKVNLYLALARAWYPMDLDSMEKYNTLAFTLSEETGFMPGLMRSSNGKALINMRKQNFQEALAGYHQALAYGLLAQDNDYLSIIANNIGVLYMNIGSVDSSVKYNEFALEYGLAANNPARIAKAKMDLSGLAGYRGDYAGAIRNLLDAQKIFEDFPNLQDLSRVYLRLGVQYSNLRDFPSSRYYYRKAELLNDSMNDADFRQSLLNNLGYLYYQVKKDYDSARYFLYEAHLLAEQRNDENSMLIANLNIGNTFVEEKDDAKAMIYYQKVMESPRFETQNLVQAAVWVNLGTIYFNQGERDQALQFTKKGLALSIENHYLEFQRNALNTLASIQKAMGNLSLALDYKEQASVLTDSLWNQELANKVMFMEFQHELDKKETENQLLQMDNEVKTGIITRQWIVLTGISLVLVLLIILIVVIIRNRNKLSRLNDLLEQKNLQLEEANKTKDRFFSIVAHDLRSPFNALSGLLAELDEHYQEYDEGIKKQILQNLRRSTQNTYNLLNNLLDWAQSQQNKLSSHPVELNPREVTQEVFQVLQTRATLKNIQLISNIDPELQVSADPNLLKALLINLINNAIKFTTKNGLIEVTAGKEGEKVRICIRDTGIGIPADQLQNLFRLDNPFKRPGTENEAGTGLGLIMCREYLDIMGGSISVESREGEGSVFCITIPER